jgi:transposase
MSKQTNSVKGDSRKAQREAPKRKSSDRGGSTKKRPRAGKAKTDWEVKHPAAAGIDIGSREHWVSVPKSRAQENVRRFGTTTPQLEEMVQWLQECGIENVAMESTAMYWLPAYEMLQEAGIGVELVDARQTRNVSGRKSDQSDCEWIQQLHTYGLLKAAFRPEDSICRLRTLQRHRKSMVEAGSMFTQHMQKALDGMNLHIHHALSSLTGTSGMAMLEAIVAGERDPGKLATMADRRVKKSAAQLEAALTGNYRHEELFVLEQSLESYRHAQRQIEQCDQEIARQLEAISQKCRPPQSKHRPALVEAPCAAQPSQASTPADQAQSGRRRPPRRTEQEHKAAALLERILGVDLTAIPGLGVLAVLTLLSEIGYTMSRWRNAKALPQPQDQRRTSAQRQEPQSGQSRRDHPAHGGDVSEHDPDAVGVLLPPQKRATRGTQSNHRHGSENRLFDLRDDRHRHSLSGD